MLGEFKDAEDAYAAAKVLAADSHEDTVLAYLSICLSLSLLNYRRLIFVFVFRCKARSRLRWRI
jgi:hypothetical protein